MQNDLQDFYRQVNHARYHGQPGGHYESYFLRANHPDRPLAFWIRYTLFCPKKKPEQALGELWAVYFDGETKSNLVAKQEYPLADCLFDPAAFNVQVGQGQLGPNFASGAVEAEKNCLKWELSFDGSAAPLLLLPPDRYESKFPAAKSLVSLPMARFVGYLTVNGEPIHVDNWVGSQNHNWGRRHTDLYAWGQVAGFDDAPESFLEVATARLRLGPFWSPHFTPLVLRHKQKEYTLTALGQAMRKARGRFDYFTWEFQSHSNEVEIRGAITAADTAFVGLSYYNPPGGVKHCLNTKIAACRVHVLDKTTGLRETLQSRHRAAFEILTDDRTHGVPISA